MAVLEFSRTRNITSVAGAFFPMYNIFQCLYSTKYFMAVLEFSMTRNITPVAGAVRSKVGVKPEYRAAIPSVWIQDYNHHVL